MHFALAFIFVALVANSLAAPDPTKNRPKGTCNEQTDCLRCLTLPACKMFIVFMESNTTKCQESKELPYATPEAGTPEFWLDHLDCGKPGEIAGTDIETTTDGTTPMTTTAAGGNSTTDTTTTTVTPTTTTSTANSNTTTTENPSNSTTTGPSNSTTTTATTTTTTLPDNTTVPDSTTTPASTTTTLSIVTSTAEPAPANRGNSFNGWSFFGGMLLMCGMFGIAFVGFKYYKLRSGSGGNYARF